LFSGLAETDRRALFRLLGRLKPACPRHDPVTLSSAATHRNLVHGVRRGVAPSLGTFGPADHPG
jgi:queuine/archaeosine tRNA-ribosyltransferase